MSKKNPLIEGALGKHLVEYFEKEHQRTAIDAEVQGEPFNHEELTGNYRITFDDETVEDWKFYFPSFYTFQVTWAEMYDKII